MSYEVTFTDNMEVTLENMNDIVKDLGDAEFSEFSTNKFGVDALNSITSDLVSSGILRTEENANMGCVPTISGTNVIVGTGVIVFATGAKLRIKEAETFAKTNSTYIYAKNDHITGMASLVMSETAPTNQMDAVQICRIDANGNLIDLRSSAVAKVPLTADAENIGVIKRIQIKVSGNSSYSYDVGFNGWKYIIFRYGTNLEYIDVIELNDNEYTAIFPQTHSSSSSGHIYAGNVHVYRRGSVLEFQNTNSNQWSSTGYDVEVEFR